MNQPAFLGPVPLVGGFFLSGAPQGRLWWIHHIMATRLYLEATLADRAAERIEAVKRLWLAAIEWQTITKSPIAGALIGEHTMLAKLLIDCKAGGSGEDCAKVAVQALLDNVTLQRMLFPIQANRFADLFLTHVEITGSYIDALAAGDAAAFEENFRKAIENGKDLQRFTDQAFG